MGDLVHVPYGTMLIMDVKVVHAGGIVFSGDSNLRLQFAFSNDALPVEHTQIKGCLETEYTFNVEQRVCLAEVSDDFVLG